jgi:hypothetical protein
MKRFLISAVAAATLAAALVPAAHAVDVPAAFTVSVDLTSKCEVQSQDTATLAFTYAAFAGSAATQTAPINVVFKCTRNLAAPTAKFDDDGSTKSSSVTGASPTGVGLVAGLRYTITATRGAEVAGDAADLTGVGSASTIAYQITGSIAGGQAGDSGALATQARTLYLVY